MGKSSGLGKHKASPSWDPCPWFGRSTPFPPALTRSKYSTSLCRSRRSCHLECRTSHESSLDSRTAEYTRHRCMTVHTMRGTRSCSHLSQVRHVREHRSCRTGNTGTMLPCSMCRMGSSSHKVQRSIRPGHLEDPDDACGVRKRH